jgi:hypothetical protein
MRPPALAISAYIATLLIAVSAAIVHPWFGVEAHFVRAVTGLSTAMAGMTGNMATR